MKLVTGQMTGLVLASGWRQGRVGQGPLSPCQIQVDLQGRSQEWWRGPAS